jgi:hypothetical protein
MAHRFSRLLLVVAAFGLAAIAASAGGASAARPRAHAAAYSITLNLQGGIANRIKRACGSANHYTYYHRGRRIRFTGTVTPRPPAPHVVKVKIKKCVRGRFVRVKVLYPRVDSRGKYGGVFRVRGRGFFFARTYVLVAGRPKGQKEHFRTV